MTRQFTQKVQMPCTAAQYRLIHPDLRKIGYDCLEPGGPDGMKMVYVSNGTVSWHNEAMKKPDFTLIDTFHPLLFVALAAMTNDRFGGLCESWVYIGATILGQFTNGNMHQQQNRDVRDKGAFIDDLKQLSGYSFDVSANLRNFRKATEYEIISHLMYRGEIFDDNGVSIGVRGPAGGPGLVGNPDDAPRKGGWVDTHDEDHVTIGSVIGNASVDKPLIEEFKMADSDENTIFIVDQEGLVMNKMNWEHDPLKLTIEFATPMHVEFENDRKTLIITEAPGDDTGSVNYGQSINMEVSAEKPESSFFDQLEGSTMTNYGESDPEPWSPTFGEEILVCNMGELRKLRAKFACFDSNGKVGVFSAENPTEWFTVTLYEEYYHINHVFEIPDIDARQTYADMYEVPADQIRIIDEP